MTERKKKREERTNTRDIRRMWKGQQRRVKNGRCEEGKSSSYII